MYNTMDCGNRGNRGNYWNYGNNIMNQPQPTVGRYNPQIKRENKAGVPFAPFMEPVPHDLPDISFMTVGDKDAAYALENPDCKSAALPHNVLNADGQRMIEIPDFESMTMFMMRRDGADQRRPIYDFLNQQLRLGRLSRIVGFPVLNRYIDGAACNLKRFNYWELSRNEFYADIEVELKGKVAELACGYGGGSGALISMGALDRKDADLYRLSPSSR